MVDVVEDESHPEAICRGQRAKVYSDVDDGSMRTPDKLSVTTVGTQVQTPDSTPARARLNFLDQVPSLQTGCESDFGVEGAGDETEIVLLPGGLEHDRPVQDSRHRLQRPAPNVSAG
jgi:hypothetical protein